jgi:hypothetical protein
MRTLLYVALIGLLACADATAPAAPLSCDPSRDVSPAAFQRDGATLANRYTLPYRNADTIVSAPSSVGVVRLITWKSNRGCQTLYDSLMHRMVKVTAP